MNFLDLPLAVLFLLLLFVLQPCLAEDIDASTLIYRGEMGNGSSQRRKGMPNLMGILQGRA
jgi:hypothetical protein